MLNEGAIISVVKWMFSPIIHATTNRIGAHRIYTPNRDERGDGTEGQQLHDGRNALVVLK